MASPVVVDLTQNDTEPLEVVRTSTNITGWSVALHVLGAPVLVVPMVVTDGPNGKATATFASGDLDPGIFEAHVQYTKPGPTVETSVAFWLNVKAELA